MPPPKEPVVISQASAISVGLVRILLVMIIGGTIFIANLSSNVSYVGELMLEVKIAVERNTATMVETSQRVAVYEAEIRALRERLARLEK